MVMRAAASPSLVWGRTYEAVLTSNFRCAYVMVKDRAPATTAEGSEAIVEAP